MRYRLRRQSTSLHAARLLAVVTAVIFGRQGRHIDRMDATQVDERREVAVGLDREFESPAIDAFKPIPSSQEAPKSQVTLFHVHACQPKSRTMSAYLA